MFKLERKGLVRRTVRLTSDAGLDAADFAKIAEQLRTSPVSARKIGLVAARKAVTQEHVETRWNGKESQITAEPGDWIVTALSKTGDVLRDRENSANTYAIKPAKFAELYEATERQTAFGGMFRPRGIVKAVFLSGGFDIKAPWGERQQAKTGYLLLNGSDVYGNNKETFEATYEEVG